MQLFATPQQPGEISAYRAGIARGDDFAGNWSAYLDGEPATIVLEFDQASGTLHGSCAGTLHGSCAGTWHEDEVIGRPGGAVPHQVALTLRAPDDGRLIAELSGYLSSRPKNAISGTMTVADTSFGFLMIRFA